MAEDIRYSHSCLCRMIRLISCIGYEVNFCYFNELTRVYKFRCVGRICRTQEADTNLPDKWNQRTIEVKYANSQTDLGGAQERWRELNEKRRASFKGSFFEGHKHKSSKEKRPRDPSLNYKRRQLS